MRLPRRMAIPTYKESNREIRKNERPALTDTVQNMDAYDIVFVGYPVWWHATPAPVNTFLESYDLTGKLIIPFCTSGGSDIDETMPTFLNSCDGLAVYGEKSNLYFNGGYAYFCSCRLRTNNFK